MGEQYTPGHSANATAFMAARSFGSHGEFIRPYLAAGMKVLDCGCGPGAISVGLAEAIGPAGHVTGESRVIAEYLALQLEQAGDGASAVALRRWAALPWSLFAQAWVSAIGVKA